MTLDFKKINFKDAEALSIVRREAQRIIENNWTDHASKLWHALRDALPTVVDQDRARTYQVIMQDLGWILLPVLTETQRFALLRGSLLRAIQIGIELESALTRLVYSIPTLIWLEVAPQYVQALRENTEPLGPKTLGAWFSDFQRSMPDQKPTDLDVLRYLGQDPAARELPEAEHTLLIKAFQYYSGLTPLSLAEVDKYVTSEERAAFAGETAESPGLPTQPPQIPPDPPPQPTPIIEQPSSAPPAPPAIERSIEQTPPAVRPVFPPLPKSPSSPARIAPGSPDKTVPIWSDLPESDSSLDRTPILRPRHDGYRMESESRNQELGKRDQDGNESVINLRQPPRPPMPQRSAPPQLPRQPYQAAQPAPVQSRALSAPIPPRDISQAPQPRPAPQYATPQPSQQQVTLMPSQPGPASPSAQSRPLPAPATLQGQRPPQGTPTPQPSQSIKAAPPPNLPVLKHTHNEGQEVAPYHPPEPDPFMPHKPKPVPRLAGNVVDLKRE